LKRLAQFKSNPDLGIFSLNPYDTRVEHQVSGVDWQTLDLHDGLSQ